MLNELDQYNRANYTFTNFYLNILSILAGIYYNKKGTCKLLYINNHFYIINNHNPNAEIKKIVMYYDYVFLPLESNPALYYNPLAHILTLPESFKQDHSIMNLIDNLSDFTNIDHNAPDILENITKLQIRAQNVIEYKFRSDFDLMCIMNYDQCLYNLISDNIYEVDNNNDDENMYYKVNDSTNNKVYLVGNFNQLYRKFKILPLTLLRLYSIYIKKLQQETNIKELKHIDMFPNEFDKVIKDPDKYNDRTSYNSLYAIPNSIFNIITYANKLKKKYKCPNLYMPKVNSNVFNIYDTILSNEISAIESYKRIYYKAEIKNIKFSYCSLFSSYNPTSLIQIPITVLNNMPAYYISSLIPSTSPFLGNMQNDIGGLYPDSDLQYMSPIWITPLFNNETFLTGTNYNHLIPLMIPSSKTGKNNAANNQYLYHFENNVIGSITYENKVRNSMIPYEQSHSYSIKDNKVRFLVDNYNTNYKNLDFTYYITYPRSAILIQLMMIGIMDWISSMLFKDISLNNRKNSKFNDIFEVKSGIKIFNDYFQGKNGIMLYHKKMPIYDTSEEGINNHMITIGYNLERLKHTFYIYVYDSMKVNLNTISKLYDMLT